MGAELQFGPVRLEFQRAAFRTFTSWKQRFQDLGDFTLMSSCEIRWDARTQEPPLLSFAV